MDGKLNQVQAKVSNLKSQIEADGFIKRHFDEMVSSRKKLSKELPNNSLATFEKEIAELLVDIFEVNI